MAKLVLIDSLGWQDGLFNLGLAYLVASLRQAGHEAEVLDLNNRFRTPDEVVAEIGLRRPDYVGFSVKSATFANAVELHRKLEAVFPEMTYVYGGPHVTLSGPSILDEAPRAYFLRGDAEYTIVDLVTRHEAGERVFPDIAGLVYRDPGGEARANEIKFHKDINDLPLPDFSTFDSIASFRTYPLLTSRGCPYKCTYCSVPAISGSLWVYRNAESVMRELDHVINHLGMRSVVIVDDNFTIHKRRAESICQAVIDRGYEFVWSCGNGIRADRIWPDLAELMYQAGCREVAFGIESWDADVFARLTKGEELSHIKHGVEVVRAAGIKVTGFFMIGLPGSTYRKDLRTLAMARRLGLDNYYFGLTVPYPGTELWDWAQANARFLIPWQNSYHISEVFRDGLERLKLEPVFDTPEYPAEERRRMFRMVQSAKARNQSRSIRAIQNSLRSAPGRPIVVLRTSRRDELFGFFQEVCPGSPHVLVWKGRSEFLRTLPAPVFAAYETVGLSGDGFLSAADADERLVERLSGAVVVFDVPGGSLEKYGNVLELARALRPRQIVACLGDRFQLVPVDEAEPLGLASPEMEPSYLGIDPLVRLDGVGPQRNAPIEAGVVGR
jgi:radical SAM superfamily enzyme YgiQ (UPF0313 family)